MAQIDLGSIKFNWKGSYSGATAYVVDDVVESSGSSYICIAATTGNAPPNATYWEQMSSAGTNGTDGTDLGTVLTTQGDIVYRDASGLARLGAGTSGQVLQTNGTGANPSWGTVSSDFVLLSTDDITSSTASVSRDVFSSTYETYKVIINGIKPTSASGSNLWYRIRQSNADLTASEYYNHGHQAYWNSSSNGDGPHNESWGVDYGVIYNRNHKTVNHGGNYEFNIYNAVNSDTRTHIVGLGSLYDDSGDLRHVRFTSWYEGTNNTMSGISIYFQSVNIADGNIKIYGLK